MQFQMLRQKFNPSIMLATVILLLSITQLQTTENLADRLAVDAVVVAGGDPSSCAPEQERQEAIEKILNSIRSNIPFTVKGCGDRIWYQITSLDMTVPLQQCPTPWQEYNENSVRACG